MAEPYTQEEIDTVLATLIGFAGNARAAHRHLEEQGERCPAPETMGKWASGLHWERYEELRELYAAKTEGRLVNDMLDISRRAAEATGMAVDAALKNLETGRDTDPSRTAMHLAKVMQTSTEKRMTLQGRPTRILENRDATEILRSLVARGVLQAPEAKELESGDDHSDD